MNRLYRKPHRVKKKKPIFKNWFFWLSILILFFFGGIFYLLFFHSFFQVNEIIILGNEKLMPEELQFQIEEDIKKDFLFSQTKSIFLVNNGQIEKKIFDRFPLVEKVHLKKKFPDTIVLEVKERKPVAILCLKLSSGELKNFFIDKYGIIFEAAENNLQEIDMVKLRKETNEEINLGEKVMTEEEVTKVLEINLRLKNDFNILIQEILIVSDGRFNVQASEGFQVYFNFQEDINWQLTKLKVVLEKEIPPEKRKDLEYIDVRFGNFAPYKYR